MRTAVAQAKPRTAKEYSFPAPTAGWISNRNLSLPKESGGQGAAVLENFFPTTKVAVLRRGRQLYATLGDGDKTVTALFTYKVGVLDEMFAATEDGIWNVTTVTNPYNWALTDEFGNEVSTEGGDVIGESSTAGLDVMSATVGGDWIVTQFATAGGVFLRGVNGEDIPFVYDGVSFEETPALTFPVDVTVQPQDLAYVWPYKTRLFFIQKESLDAWYLPVDTIAGELTKLPLGGMFALGGSLLFGASWSLGDGAQGGLSEQCVFITTEGEVAVFQGDNPSSAAAWQKVGVYRIGRPLGKRAFIRAGGDIIIATSIGMVPLSQAIQKDFAALAPAAVSYPIEDDWNEAVHNRAGDWNTVIWPDSQMVVVVPPSGQDNEPVTFVANARSGAWAPFTNWDATALCIWRGRLFMGGHSGRVIEGNVGGLDEGVTYTGRYIPLFEDIGSPDALKIASTGRFTLRAGMKLRGSVSCRFDYDTSFSPPPEALAVPVGNQWNNGIWGESIWSGRSDAVISNERVSLGGTGYTVAPTFQITSGAIVPLDVEVVRADITVTVADVVT